MVNLPGLTPDGANTSKVFIAIKNGKIIYKDRESGNEYQFKNITGIITGISSHTVTFNNSQQPTDFFDITIKAEDTVYVLSVVKDSGAARQIINSLASVKDFSHTLVIEPWLSSAKSNGEKPYTNVSVYVDSPINENGPLSFQRLRRSDSATVACSGTMASSLQHLTGLLRRSTKPSAVTPLLRQ